MLTLIRRVVAVLVFVSFTAGNVAACAGWASAAEARMACCAQADACPMHSPDAHHASAQTQAQADGCCAATEGRRAAPSVGLLLLPSGIAPVAVPVALPQTAAPRDAWRTRVPIRGTHVAKHLLLSVLLV